MGCDLEGEGSQRQATPADFDYHQWSTYQLARVEDALEHFVSADAPANLGEVMRYAVLGGGKRLRPLLVLATAQAVGIPDSQAALRAACAVELIHAYSLVHDDMPCMDNDVLRRGQPTVHVKYGEALALLAADALQALAFEVLTPDDVQGQQNKAGNEIVPYMMQARLVSLLSRSAGALGMAGGQAIDLSSVGIKLNEEQLQEMHQRKTGALLQCCVAMGMVCSVKHLSAQAADALMTYAHCLGLAFQVVDDVLDATAPSVVIGKTAGKDENAGKPTYVSILGLEQARQRAHNLHEQASKALLRSGLQQVEYLQALATQMVIRSY